MPSLGDVQAGIRQALLSGVAAPLAPVLVGGRNGVLRLSIHQRHFETSLVTALVEKFPATAWLIGSEALTRAAVAFVKAEPPRRPCIAEYGDTFPTFLAAHSLARALPYLEPFAELEWRVGQVSIATSARAVDWGVVLQVGADALPQARLGLQPGLRYLHAPMAVDDLMNVYLAGTAPEQFVLATGDVWIEVRGARGELQVSRLDPATFLFRACLQEGATLGDAAARALERDEAFDAGRALAALLTDGLLTSVTPEERTA